jgi:hypothetical protein
MSDPGGQKPAVTLPSTRERLIQYVVSRRSVAKAFHDPRLVHYQVGEPHIRMQYQWFLGLISRRWKAKK